MKKNLVVGIAVAIGMLSFGALSALAAETCGKCADAEAVQQFTRETAGLTRALIAKDIELREQNSYNSIDSNKVNALEAEMKELKSKINSAAQKNNIPACSRS